MVTVVCRGRVVVGMCRLSCVSIGCCGWLFLVRVLLVVDALSVLVVVGVVVGSD